MRMISFLARESMRGSPAGPELSVVADLSAFVTTF